MHGGIPSQDGWIRYSLPALSVAAMALVCLALHSAVRGESIDLLLALAIMISAVFGGFGPGLCATALGALVRLALCSKPVFGVPSSVELGLFLSVGVGITLICDAFHRVHHRQATEEDLRRSNQRLELISDVAGQLLASSEPRNIVQSLCQKVMAYLDCQVFLNFLLDEHAQRLHLNASAGVPAEDIQKIEWMDLGAHISGCVARDACCIVPENIDNIHDVRTRLVRSLGIKAYACRPLISKDRVLGTLAFGSRTRTAFRPDELALMKTVADHIAIAMERLRFEEALQAANRAKDDFLAALSHELRTPLNPVLLATSAMESAGNLPPELCEDITMIRRNVELEARLIDDLLDLTRITRGKMKLEFAPTDIHETIRDVITICHGDISQKRLSLSVDLAAESCMVSADRTRLHQVFWNILKNAVKFTPEEGCITIRSRNRQSLGPRVSDLAQAPDIRQSLAVEVTDTGIGIEPELLPRIFNAFEQGEGPSRRRFGGLGLGLTICKALMEMHGGTITAASEGKNKGSTLRVELTTTTQAAPAQAIALPPEPTRHQLRILLVEDHESTASVMTRLLRMLDHDVQSARSVQTALELADRLPFDLVISTIGLPDGSGTDLMRELKARHGLSGIALTGLGMEMDIHNSRLAGFAAHLVKPITLAQLQTALNELAAAMPIATGDNPDNQPDSAI